MADLGEGVLDAAMVGTAAYCLRKDRSTTATFFRMLESGDKPTDLLDAITKLQEGVQPSLTYIVEPQLFRDVPGSPFAYWVSNDVRALFKQLPPFETDGRTVKVGCQTGEDFRFVRAWWEVPPIARLNATGVVWCERDRFQAWCRLQSMTQSRWFSFAKGGDYLPFYADISLVGNWHRDGMEIRHFADVETSKLKSRPQNTGLYFCAGYTYPLRTSRLCPQVMPAGTLISVRGSGIYGDTTGVFLALLGSRPFDYLIKLMLGRTGHPQFDMGDINVTPVPKISPEDGKRLAALALRCVEVKRTLDSTVEESHVFTEPLTGCERHTGLHALSRTWVRKVESAITETNHCQSQIDDIAFRLYKIEGEDRKAMEADNSQISDNADTEAVEGGSTEDRGCNLAERVVSHAIGCAFGRWDVSVATGEKPTPKLPDPFAPLPPCSPGMLQNIKGLPAEPRDISADYPLRISWPGILVDDPGHPEDVDTRIREVFKVRWKDQADDVYREATEILDSGADDLRQWFRRNFFDEHISRYSKGGRKAPIYWCIGTPSGSYSVWLYYQRFTKDTLYKVLNDFVKPKLDHEERKLTALRQEAGPTPTKSQGKDIEAQEIFVSELKAFRDEVALVAPLWAPDLNDGVILNFAPIWRLVSLKSWQKECRTCWEGLVAGDYDWSHLAMHLWPERVVPKCSKDRSLAIAHELEDFFWEEDEDGKWTARDVKKKEFEEQIDVRSSRAGREAVESLTSAIHTSGLKKRAKGNR